MSNATGTRERIFRTRIAHIESIKSEFEDWASAHRETATAYEAQDWAIECIHAGKSTIDESTTAFASLRTNSLPWDVVAYGKALGSLLDIAASLFAAVDEFLASLKNRGYDLENEMDFRSVHARLLKTQRRFLEVWPKKNEEMWRKTAEHISRGEVESTEEILHGLRAG